MRKIFVLCLCVSCLASGYIFGMFIGAERVRAKLAEKGYVFSLDYTITHK